MLTKPYPHQAEALSALKNFKGLGRVIIPTGGGKTLIESYYLRDTINKSRKNRIHVVLAPRIVLVNQLIKEYRGYIGQKYIALAFHSGRAEVDFELVKWNEKSTTSTDVVKEDYARAIRMGKDLVIFSTYKSAHKLKRFPIETLICDESQYCVTEDYHETVKQLNANTKLFFTATERHTLPEGRGLNNSNVFGDVLYQVSPKALIERGVIVAPRLHLMYAESADKVRSIIDEVKHVASKQIELTEKEMPVTKVLFAMRGTNDVKTIAENYDKIKEKYPDYSIFTIVSNAKYGAMVDGVKMGRGNFFHELRETDKALIFHYDILAEGIDIDGITGVAILRNLKKAKLLQTIGRAVRKYKADPDAKKQAWVSVTAINGDIENQLFIRDVITTLRDGGFDINNEEVAISDSMEFGIADDNSIDNAYEIERRKKANLFLDNVQHDIEWDEILENVHEKNDQENAELFLS